MGYSVGDLARFAHVTVRTLHHYDRIGLLSPSGRTDAGYRVYDDADLDRLQRVLGYRELGFGLDEIAGLLDGADPVEALRRQHAELTARMQRLGRIVATLEKTMEARQMGINLEPHELLEVFGDADPTEHADEARERWGDTEAYRESQRRTSAYTKDDWLAIREQTQQVEQALAAALASGAAPDSAQAMDAAEAHRQSIRRWFYDCPPQLHVGLAEMYVADARFTAHYEDIAPGLAQFVHDAIVANAARQGGD